MKVPVFTLNGEKKGEVELNDAIFAYQWKNDLVYQVSHALMNNARRPWAHTKDRSEKRGGGAKPWRQKGTGRARHGSRRSPLWAGGGVTFGPRKDKDYSQKINKKMKTAALYSVLSKKLADGELQIVEDMKIKESKTKELSSALRTFYAGEKANQSTLLVALEKNKSPYQASKNLEKVDAKPATSVSVNDLLSHKNVLIEKEALIEIK